MTTTPSVTNKKIKILVIPSDRTGVGKFRSVDPHVALQNLYGNEFHVDIIYDPPYQDLNFFKNFDIISYHRSIGPDFEKSLILVSQLRQLGIPTVCDIDDYWLPGKEHPIHDIIKFHKINEKIVASLKAAQYVTTTTTLFAEEIKKIQKNVVIFPNAIDPNEPQFKEPTLPSDRVRFGWLGGSSHLHDLQLLNESIGKLHSVKDQLKFVVCGFDTRGTVTEINSATGEHVKRDIRPEETVWASYEKIFTQNFAYVSDDYKNYLLKYSQEEEYDHSNESYHRVWTQPVTTYAKNYSKFDVSLAPIKNHMFNRMKSQLKVIEAGFYKKALIASNLGPYTIDLTHAFKFGKSIEGGNALLVDETRNHSDWAKNITLLLKNPNLITDLGEKLYETVKDKYDLAVVTKQRAEFYKSII